MDNHLGMLCDISELHAVLAHSEDTSGYLQQIVDMVARHLNTDICSIYLYNDSDQQLTLSATHGLRPDSIGRVQLSTREGLVGLALRELRPIRVTAASDHPAFKAVPGIDEEPYDAFLAVPILRGVERLGVLVVQRRKRRPFEEHDELALRATASQLAGAVANARFFIALSDDSADGEAAPDTPALGYVHGEVASEGFAVGNALVLNKQAWGAFFRRHAPSEHYSLADFEAAAERTECQLQEMQKRVEEKVSDVTSLIFEAQILMLKDPALMGRVRQRISSGEGPPAALVAVAGEYIEMLSQSKNSYTREKAKDVEDLAVRLFSNMVARERTELQDRHGCVVIARELYPSDILKLSSEEVSGIILVSGGVTSHVSILASSLQIPMVIADHTELLRIPESTRILLDAEAGGIWCNPSRETVENYRRQHEARASEPLAREQPAPETHTDDGARIHLQANINLLADVNLANDMRAEGIGLYRTEFPFLVRANFPSEEEQLVVYTRLVDMCPGRSITFRTLDIGGDKMLAYYEDALEENPTMGMRSIRFCLRHLDIFRQQVRAILRAGHDAGELRLMFPMIASLDEFVKARDVVHECREELAAAGIPHNTDTRVGLMIEVPSTVEIIDALAREADFFCVGTNDFIQFLLAVDRGNAKVSDYYLPHHPAVLRALKRVAAAALAADTEVSICGEMAHEVLYVPFLIGIGVRTLSLDAHYLQRVQTYIGGLQVDACEAHAARLLEQETVRAVEAELVAFGTDRH
jgi:phosphotransferase system enzyme I (PtsP)